MGDSAEKMKVMVPFFQLVEIIEYIHALLSTHTAFSAYKHQDTNQVVKGTKVVEVLERFLSVKKNHSEK